MGFQKAVRENIFAKVLLGGPSGSGKTYSGLALASGISSKMNNKVAAIDTENGRIRYYASEFSFDDIQLEQPYSPSKYIDCIDMAVEAGYDVLVIDSLSHEWIYCLDVHSKMPGNSYTNWSKITPMHDSFMEKILQSKIHIIATARGKDEYVLESKDGKQVPKKMGVGIKQRDDVEYNYTCTFMLDQQSHIADCTKDNTHIFEGRYEKLSTKDGVRLWEWCNGGVAPQPKPIITKPSESTQPTTTTIKATSIATPDYSKEALKQIQDQIKAGYYNEKDVSATIKEIFDRDLKFKDLDKEHIELLLKALDKQYLPTVGPVDTRTVSDNIEEIFN